MNNPKVTTRITDERLKELAESPFRVVADSAETKLIAQELLELREAARNKAMVKVLLLDDNEKEVDKLYSEYVRLCVEQKEQYLSFTEWINWFIAEAIKEQLWELAPFKEPK